MSDSGITYASGPGWNPASGCLHDCHSEKCWERCWARRMARRQAGRNGYPKGAESFKPTLHPDKLGQPRRRKKPQVIPVAFMADLFCGAFSWEYIDRIFQDMEEADWHTYLILTKRIDNAAAYLEHWLDTACWEKTGCPIYGDGDKLRPHIRIGTTVMTQEDADTRLPHLVELPAVTWVSLEPALEEVNILGYLMEGRDPGECANCGAGHGFDRCPNYGGVSKTRTADQYGSECHDLKRKNFAIYQVNMGCESGPGRRHTPEKAFRSMRDQCDRAGVAFYLKQIEIDGRVVEKPFLDGRQWLEEPQVNW